MVKVQRMEIRYRYISIQENQNNNQEDYIYSENLLLNYQESETTENNRDINADLFPESLIRKKFLRKKRLDNFRKDSTANVNNLGRPDHRELPPVGAAHLLLPWDKPGLGAPNGQTTYGKPGSSGNAGGTSYNQQSSQQPEWGGYRKHDEGETARRIAEINQELDTLIGLDKVKKLVKEIQAFVEIQHKRAREQLVTDPLVLHMIFSGNPGTGKTTVARIIGRLFKEMGVLQKGHLIEVERADLVGEYIGHTAQKTRDQVKRALGGILFIDEAYSLARGGERDFGKESIDALVKAMEDNKDNLILIMAGYREEMDQFVRANPGVRSRFPLQIAFPDYTVDELMQIANLMLSHRQYCFSAEARTELERILELQIREGMGHNGNARLVRNLIERGIRRQAVRLIAQKVITREDLILIRQQDIEKRAGDA